MRFIQEFTPLSPQTEKALQPLNIKGYKAFERYARRDLNAQPTD